MKKLISIVVLSLTIVVVSGCSAFSDPSFAGNMAGKAVYLTYQKVAEKKSPEFKAKIATIWDQVNSIHSTSDLVSSYSRLSLRFDDVINSKGLSESEMVMLYSIKNDISNKIDQIVGNQAVSNSEGIKFLIGMRNGISEMIQSDKNK